MFNKSQLKITIEKEILEICEFLDNYKAFANVNLCDFLIHDHWSVFVPTNFAGSLLDLKENLFKLPSGVINIEEKVIKPDESLKIFSKNPTLKQFVTTACQFNLSNLNSLKPIEISQSVRDVNESAKEIYSHINSFMKEKKLYEVSLMAGVCQDICQELKTNKVVDIGAGLGYLGIYMGVVNGSEVVSVEGVDGRNFSAIKRKDQFKKQWKSVLNRSLKENNNSQPPSKNFLKFFSHQQYFEENLTKGSFRPISSVINHHSDLDKLCQDLHSSTHPIILTGLHSCGDLSSNMIRMFSNSQQVSGLCLVGCCYNLLSECSSSSRPARTPGFPLSNFLVSRSTALGPYLKLLACQSSQRTASNVNYSIPRSLFWRALLQLILVEKIGPEEKLCINKGDNEKEEDVFKMRFNEDEKATRSKDKTTDCDGMLNNISNDDVNERVIRWRVGRISEKCSTFSQYVRMALEKSKLSVQISEEEITQYESKYSDSQLKCTAFYYLRCCLGQCVEALIQLDRTLYLLENENVKRVVLSQLFDPVISPRCFVIVAVK